MNHSPQDKPGFPAPAPSQAVSSSPAASGDVASGNVASGEVGSGGVAAGEVAAGSVASNLQPAPAQAGLASPAPASQGKGLSRTQYVIELADSLSQVADQLHERILREIRSYAGNSVPERVQDAMRKLLDDEMVLRQRANSLYADAAAYVIHGLDQPQSRLLALTADAAHKIRRIGVIAEVTGLVGGLLLLAGAVASGKPTPVALALEKIQLHSTALDALHPEPPTAA